MYEYLEAPEGWVDLADPNARPRAEKVLGVVSRMLELGAVKVRWFVDTDWIAQASSEAQEVLAKARRGEVPGMKVFKMNGDIRGSYFNRGEPEIWCRVGLDEIQQAKTIAHELRHLWQFRLWGEPETETEKAHREEDAQRFAEDVRAGFVPALSVWR